MFCSFLEIRIWLFFCFWQGRSHILELGIVFKLLNLHVADDEMLWAYISCTIFLQGLSVNPACKCDQLHYLAEWLLSVREERRKMVRCSYPTFLSDIFLLNHFQSYPHLSTNPSCFSFVMCQLATILRFSTSTSILVQHVHLFPFLFLKSKGS